MTATQPSRPPSRRDAVLVVGFGGPEGPADVRPFLENVTRGRAVPPERLDEVEAHYQAFGGRSPLNDQLRSLIAALRRELDGRGEHGLRIYWGNRNWHPFLADTMARMAADGVTRAFTFVTSAFSSYSGCRQYLEDLHRAQPPGGEIAVEKLRVFFDHPGFILPMVERVQSALAAPQLAAAGPGRGPVALLYCAHSIPRSQADTSDYVTQLRAAMDLVSARVDPGGRELRPELVWQSRSGPPQVPWLEPDVGERLVRLADDGVSGAVLVPIGFLSDHLEVVYDLDVVALDVAARHGVRAVRAATVGTDPRFVAMIADLVAERRAAADGATPRRPALSNLGVWPDHCRADCCPPPARSRPAG
jgi:ferrochelatase